MIHFPNCKINIGLYVTGKRTDGYHEIQSVFYPLPLRDALEITPAEETQFESYGTSIPGNAEDNLVLKAWHLMHQYHAGVQPVNIALLKNIPMGAGLGGGSADAAEMLKMLNQLFELHLDDTVLAEYALTLGSDCPFFIKNTACFAKGRGEILDPIALDLSEYNFVLAKPDLHISTPWAFSQIIPKASGIDLTTLIQQPVAHWRNAIKNDFETPVFKKFPQIEVIKNNMYEHGALYSSMSGSGSAVYGIFQTKPDLQKIRKDFYNADLFSC